MRATNRKTLTQTERVITAARSFRGISRVDFQLPNVIDGGDPILNFPARIQDAEERFGCTFEILGRRNKCKVYRLIDPALRRGADPGLAFSPGKGSHTPPRPVSVPSGGGQVSLFEVPAEPHWREGRAA